mmetsp:Transcript_13611/g.29423  ORF Transcript_13611/g.29423 Transcript_13611/m.29423 type:complete len:202 (-) Transcript_13611:62-667(-)
MRERLVHCSSPSFRLFSEYVFLTLLLPFSGHVRLFGRRVHIRCIRDCGRNITFGCRIIKFASDPTIQPTPQTNHGPPSYQIPPFCFIDHHFGNKLLNRFRGESASSKAFKAILLLQRERIEYLRCSDFFPCLCLGSQFGRLLGLFFCLGSSRSCLCRCLGLRDGLDDCRRVPSRGGGDHVEGFSFSFAADDGLGWFTGGPC